MKPISVYRCRDGSAVREVPAPFDMSCPDHEIHSPTWEVCGPPGCQADALAEALAANWLARVRGAALDLLSTTWGQNGVT